MEHIKQALEIARSERHAREVERDGATPASGAAAPVSWRDATGATPTIIYTETRTIAPDPNLLRSMRIIAGNARDSVADAYKVLRTQVLQRMRANGWTTLAITSAGEGNGKTVTAINLAISLARNVDHTVLLADLDLLHPRLFACLSREPVPGLSDYLKGEKSIAEILVHPGVDRLVILPGNEPFAHSSEILASPAFGRLVDELKTRYPNRLVLFDMPPMLACDEVLAFAPYVDAVMLVLEEGKTTEEELRRCYELLEHTNILGTVLNKGDVKGSPVGSY